MYGMVNQAIKMMVIETVNKDAWDNVCNDLNIDTKDFDSFEQFPDSLTLDLVGAICEKLKIDAPKLLESFGEYWIQFAQRSEYKTILVSFGETPLELINSLDSLHSRLELTFDNLDPPSFHTTEVSENEIIVHYNSNREMPLEYFVLGLLKGIFNMFEQKCNIKILEDSGEDKARFNVTF